MMPKAVMSDVPVFSSTNAIEIPLQRMLQKHTTNQTNVMSHHNLFDTLYRASERVRQQQKFNYGAKIEEIVSIHRKELEELAGKLYTRAITVSFIPQDSTVTLTMEEYMIKSMETGIPLHELLPPTLLAKRLDFFSSGESSSEGVTTNGGSTTQDSSSGVSSRSGDVTDRSSSYCGVSGIEDDSTSISSYSTNTSGGA